MTEDQLTDYLRKSIKRRILIEWAVRIGAFILVAKLMWEIVT